MIFFRLIIFSFFISVFACANEKLNHTYSLAISIHKFDRAQQNRIKSIASVIKKEFEEIHEGKYHVEITFVEDEEEMLKGYINYSKFNIIIPYSSYYLKNKDLIKEVSSNAFSFNSHKKFQKYILLANKDSEIKDIKDLKNKSFANYVANDNYIYWLDYITLKELGVSYKKLIRKEKDINSDSRLILETYFEKTDFTVVKKRVYEDMLLLNPSLKENLFIIKESKPLFLYGIGFLNKKIPEEMKNDFNEMMDDGTFDKKMKHLFVLLDQRSITRMDFKELNNLENFYNEYVKLKNKQ